MVIKSYTDIEQSKRLTEILPLESADMWYPDSENRNNIEFGFDATRQQMYIDYKDGLPCWSLAALLGALPEIQGGKPIIALDDNYITYPHINDLHTKANNLIDACVDMVIKLHELNLL